jgi:hypothetical protein
MVPELAWYLAGVLTPLSIYAAVRIILATRRAARRRAREHARRQAAHVRYVRHEAAKARVRFVPDDDT